MRAALAGPDWTLRELGDLAVELPRGARIWVHLGGPAAVTGETEMLMAVELRLEQLGYQNAGSKGPEPKMRDYPESVEAIDRAAAKVTNKAERWKARHQPRPTE